MDTTKKKRLVTNAPYQAFYGYGMPYYWGYGGGSHYVQQDHHNTDNNDIVIDLDNSTDMGTMSYDSMYIGDFGGFDSGGFD